MWFLINEFADQGFKSITIGHGKHRALWETPTYLRASRTRGLEVTLDPMQDSIFKELNTFIATLSGQRQQALWDAYAEAHELFRENYDWLAIQPVLQRIVQTIYAQVPFEELYEWAEASPLIHIPITMKTSYGENDPEDTTYLRNDYFGLVVLAIATRFMVPLWGEYIQRIKDNVDTTFKEFIAIKLLNQTYIFECEPYQRLLRYIDASIEHRAKEATIHSAVMSGLSSSQIPEWVLANTLVRRTSMVPLSDRNDGPNLITDVYGYVDGTLQSSGQRRFSGPIRAKRARTDEKGGEQQESLAESYKIKEEVSAGDVQAAIHYLHFPELIAQDLAPNIDLENVRSCLASITQMEQRPIHLFQKTITQWTLAKVIYMRALNTATKPALLNGIATAQALLWHWGFFDIAALLTAKEIIQDDEWITTQESKVKIPNEMMAVMQTMYINQYSVREKQVTPRAASPGAASVDAAYQLISGSDWELHAPLPLMELATHLPGSWKMYVPVNIRAQLANLLIHLYRTRLEYSWRKGSIEHQGVVG